MRRVTVDFACGAGRATPGPDGREPCELLAWAASGGMALTGWPDRAPRPPPTPLLARTERLT
ncbi:MAG TPA: hypothetical protein VGU73_09750, partial [Acidimicrobiia bacterium]|nr:hypothetical protein [Acidimicrobiia bacterium]